MYTFEIELVSMNNGSLQREQLKVRDILFYVMLCCYDTFIDFPHLLASVELRDAGTYASTSACSLGFYFILF